MPDSEAGWVFGEPQAMLAATGNTGTYYAVEIVNPTFSGGTCIAGITVLKSISGTVTNLLSSSIGCRNGMVLREIMNGSTIWIYIDNVIFNLPSD